MAYVTDNDANKKRITSVKQTISLKNYLEMRVMDNPLVTIVIPTYNEIGDIENCLKSVLSLNYANIEIIIIDGASTDGTLSILHEYEARNQIVLVEEPARRGVSIARNIGVLHGQGDIVVLLNADVILDKDFLDKVIPHYQHGADFVVCWPEVLNDSHLLPAYINANGHRKYDHKTDYVWSEGFSCRRNAFLAVGGLRPFPKASAGEDTALGKDLDKHFKKVVDKSIVVKHIVPTDWRTFFKLRYERGKGYAFYQRFYEKRSVIKKLIRLIGEILAFVLFGVLAVVNVRAMILQINKKRTAKTLSKRELISVLMNLFSLITFVGLVLRSMVKVVKRGNVLGDYYPHFRIPFIVLDILVVQCVKMGYIRGALMRFSNEKELYISTPYFKNNNHRCQPIQNTQLET